MEWSTTINSVSLAELLAAAGLQEREDALEDELEVEVVEFRPIRGRMVRVRRAARNLSDEEDGQ